MRISTWVEYLPAELVCYLLALSANRPDRVSATPKKRRTPNRLVNARRVSASFQPQGHEPRSKARGLIAVTR